MKKLAKPKKNKTDAGFKTGKKDINNFQDRFKQVLSKYPTRYGKETI
jgi:methylphosphotriester-DNA--protein-cysteine methyltransferase